MKKDMQKISPISIELSLLDARPSAIFVLLRNEHRTTEYGNSAVHGITRRIMASRTTIAHLPRLLLPTYCAKSHSNMDLWTKGRKL
jgi:hypothetical protein